MIYHFGLYLLKTYLRTKIDKHFSKVEHYKQTYATLQLHSQVITTSISSIYSIFWL